VEDYNVADCIECGCCAYVCPSRIYLVQYFKVAKKELQ
jgi:electron transport complex protein RnfC